MKKIRFRDTISTKMDFLLWKGDDGMRKNKGEKVVKSRAGWKKADQVRKIKIVMTFVVVALCISIAAEQCACVLPAAGIVGGGITRV